MFKKKETGDKSNSFKLTQMGKHACFYVCFRSIKRYNKG